MAGKHHYVPTQFRNFLSLTTLGQETTWAYSINSKHHTQLTVSHCSPTDISVPLSSMYHTIDSACTASGLWLIPVRLTGTISQNLSATQMLPNPLSGAWYKHFCLYALTH